jgi:predicted esterase
MANDEYIERLAALQRELLEMLRTFEAIQEELRPGRLGELQARMVTAVRDTFRRFESEFVAMTPPAEMRDFHGALIGAVRELEKAYDLFMTHPGPQWTLIYLHSRSAFCSGLYGLYELRGRLALLRGHFQSDGARVADGRPDDGTARGFIHRERNDKRSDYTLYVPEDYSPDSPLPLVVAMHGGFGQGREYVWTWLRPARSRGYAVLAPKSFDNTWDMSFPSIDTPSVRRMIEEVTREYAIDPARVYLTGLSDGATFSYIFGLEHSGLFRGIAPIAGVLHPAAAPMLRRGMGRDTPILVIHGVHDFIFPVAFARQTRDFLGGIGYNVIYRELPDWGHAYPYSINELMVMPWFESLPAKG